MAALVAVAGCSMPTASDFKPSKLFSLGDDDEPEQGTPVRMVCTWTDTVHTKAGEAAQRGFGGRLVFYGKKEEKPILVEGQLVVYAFDETGREVTDNKPTRRYVFPPDQVPLHMSKSELGASYSFFLPWDEVGGPQTEVSLMCRFEPKGGAVITSEQTTQMLPGTISPTAKVDGKPPRLPDGVPYRPAQPTLESVQASRIVDPNIQQAGYENPISNNVPIAAVDGAAPIPHTADSPVANNPVQMTTTSIPLPQHYRIPAGQPIVQAAATPALSNSPLVMPPQQQIGTGQQVVPPAQAILPAVQAAPATSSALPGPTALQPMRLGFNALPAPQSITPTVLMPSTYSPLARSAGLVAPYQPQAAAAQPVPQSAGTIPTRTITWNTVQPAQPVSLRQPNIFTPASAQQIGGQPATATANTLPPSTGLNTAANSPAGAATLR